MYYKLKYFVVLFFISSHISAQCAMCKAVVESGDNKMAEGINNGILYLMAMPYLLVLTAVLLYYRYYLKNKF